jgi:hypothetical protein
MLTNPFFYLFMGSVLLNIVFFFSILNHKNVTEYLLFQNDMKYLRNHLVDPIPRPRNHLVDPIPIRDPQSAFPAKGQETTWSIRSACPAAN